jgi:N-acyl-D-aspartate/D-glutamate deacylase
MAFDVLIRNGHVVDGTGAGPRRADVGVRADRIAAVGDLSAAAATRTIDATGSIVTPGFIDAHAHSDVSLVMNPVAETQVGQGITTEIMGNCGYSPFPLLENNRGYLLDPKGVELPWSSASDYVRLIEDR